MEAWPTAPARFVALDVRRQFALASAVDGAGRVVLPPQRIASAELGAWLGRTLQPGDALVLGTPADPWPLADQIAPLVAALTIVHPQIANLLPSFGRGDDPRDTLKLARMHAAGLVPGIWVPPPAVRDVRALAAQRRRLIQQHAAASAVLERLLQQCRATPPGRSRLGADQPGWWARLPLLPPDQQLARDNLAALNRAATLLRALDERLLAIGAAAPWRDQVERLLPTPGMDRLDALVLLGAIGTPTRFSTAAQLASYAGLVPGAAAPAGDTADGRRELRAAMLAVAERAAQRDAEWGARFAALEARIGAARASVALARKLLVQVWHTLALGPAARAVGDEPGPPTGQQVRPAA